MTQPLQLRITLKPQMTDVNESEKLMELLKTEQERVTKLKQLVIKEKKTVAHLNSEVVKLTAELSSSCRVCTNFESELNQLINGIATPNSGSLGVVASEAMELESHTESKACSTPCDMPTIVENAISSARKKIEMLMDELTSSKRRERFQFDRVRQLERDLEVLLPLETEITEIKTSFDLANQQVKQLTTELSECRISLTLERDKTKKLRNVIDEMDSSRAAFEELCRTENLRLGEELEKIREWYTLKCTDSDMLNQRVVDLTSNLQTMKEQVTAGSELKSNENTINGRELSHMLDKFVRELTKVLERSINGGDLDCTKPVVVPVVTRQERSDCAVQTEEISDSKDALTQALAQLEQANKQAADAQKALTEAHGESAKQEEKMQRMKSMLLRLKMDESEHQKSVTELENAKVTIEALHVDLDSMEQKLKHATLENKQHKQSLVSLLDDVEQARRESANLRSDRDFAVDRLNKLQNEFSAYKIKVIIMFTGFTAIIFPTPFC
ncbi:hypothetical protein AHF37_02755 [Paragonimus kellicotti]|nr:hypothetical protein AHF37_02755 [Paragonimus kellicotti]